MCIIINYFIVKVKKKKVDEIEDCQQDIRNKKEDLTMCYGLYFVYPKSYV